MAGKDAEKQQSKRARDHRRLTTILEYMDVMSRNKIYCLHVISLKPFESSQ